MTDNDLSFSDIAKLLVTQAESLNGNSSPDTLVALIRDMAALVADMAEVVDAHEEELDEVYEAITDIEAEVFPDDDDDDDDYELSVDDICEYTCPHCGWLSEISAEALLELIKGGESPVCPNCGEPLYTG
jgi:rubrerythrin